MVSELQAIIDNPAGFASYGGDMAKIIYAASRKEGAGDFTAQLGWTHPQEWLAPLPPPPPLPPSPKPTPIGPEEFDSALEREPDRAVEANEDYVLWLLEQALGGGVPFVRGSFGAAPRGGPRAKAASATGPAAPANGQVTQVKVRGYYVPGHCPASPESICEQNVHFQDLRPLSNGSLEVVSTPQAFTLPHEPGTYTFEPTNFFVRKGDYVGLATVGGRFEVLVGDSAVQTDAFVGHNKDMNGDQITSTKTQSGEELNMRVTLQPSS
jgi:hypothetical protein